MFDNEEEVQGTEIEVRNGEEVERGNHFTMIVQKSVPPAGFALVRNPLQPLQVARHSRFRDVEASSSNSPWMRGAPQLGFSLFMRRIKRRTSSTTFGRPTR